jgi:type I restriction enzyme S subunit
VPILRSTNIRARRIIGDILHVDPAYAMDRGSKLIRAGDLVTVRTGNAGVTARIPDELDGCQCFTMLITTLSPECDSRYFEYVLNALPANRYFSLEGWGTAQTNISVPILKALPVAVPPLDEQRSICDYLDEVTIESRALRHEAVRAIELLVERRASLISSAVTGKIDVRLVAGQINPVTPDNGGRSASASLEAA